MVSSLTNEYADRLSALNTVLSGKVLSPEEAEGAAQPKKLSRRTIMMIKSQEREDRCMMDTSHLLLLKILYSGKTTITMGESE